MLNTYGAPYYYTPTSYQKLAWDRMQEKDENGNRKYKFYIKVWSRQLGKDSVDNIYELWQGFTNPMTTGAYIGLNNKWIDNNMWRKIIGGHSIFDNFPHSSHGNIPGTDIPQPDTFRANKTKLRVDWWDGKEPVTDEKENLGFTLYIGFTDNQKLLGSSYTRYTFSEYSVYDSDPMEYIEQILDMHPESSVNINSTPRGMNNQLYKFIEAYAPDAIVKPGEIKGGAYKTKYGDVYIDYLTIWDAIPDLAKLYNQTEQQLLEHYNAVKERSYRKYGNYSMWEQEFECKFLTMAAGTVYLAAQQIVPDGRYLPLNVNPAHPVYCALDLASKANESGNNKNKDAMAIIFFQVYNGHYYIIDCYEERGMPLTQFVRQSIVASQINPDDISVGFLPWDGGVGAEKTPREFLEEEFKSTKWNVLPKFNGSVMSGINLAREWLPNLLVNSNKCERFMQCIEQYHYEWSDKKADYSDSPYHDWSSHMMDAFRYAAHGIDYFKDSLPTMTGMQTIKEWGTYEYL